MKSQRMISIGDDNMIENGRELCKIQEHMLRAKDSMEIEDPGGRRTQCENGHNDHARSHRPHPPCRIFCSLLPGRRRWRKSADLDDLHATLHAGDKADRRTRVGTFGAPAI